MFGKAIVISVTCLFMTAAGFSEVQMPTEEDYKNLDKLRSELMRMRRETDRFVRDVMATYPAQDRAAVAGFGEDVRVDVSETAGAIIVKADLPGMDKDKIDITLTNNRMLKISGSREIEKKEQAPGMVRQERAIGKFERSLELPAECSSDGIKAAYKNGVLDIMIPKKEPSKEERIKIKVQ